MYKDRSSIRRRRFLKKRTPNKSRKRHRTPSPLSWETTDFEKSLNKIVRDRAKVGIHLNVNDLRRDLFKILKELHREYSSTDKNLLKINKYKSLPAYYDSKDYLFGYMDEAIRMLHQKLKT